MPTSTRRSRTRTSPCSSTTGHPGADRAGCSAPWLTKIATERAGSLKVGKVNVDEEPHLADRAGVQGIPSVVLYHNGLPVAHAVGAQPKHALERTLGLDDLTAAAA